MFDLDDLRFFTRIADLGSVSGAARLLKKPKSSVSRSLARLEVAAGAALIERSTRRLRLTDAGRVLQRHAQRILDDVGEAENALVGLIGVPRGTLRVSVPFTFAAGPLAPMLPAFLARNIVPSKSAFGKTGAELRFGYGGAVDARRQGSGAERWFDDAGRPLSDQFRAVKGLTYSPANDPLNDPRAETYTFEKGRGARAARLGAPQGGAAQDDARRPNRQRDNRQRDNRRVRSGGGGSRGGGARGGSGNRGGRTYNDVI